MNQYKIFIPLDILVVTNIAIVITAIIVDDHNPEAIINDDNLSIVLCFLAAANLFAASAIAMAFDKLVKIKAEY